MNTATTATSPSVTGVTGTRSAAHSLLLQFAAGAALGLVVFYGVAFLGEAVTAWMLFCAVVIVCGTALSTGLLKIGQ